MHCYHMVSSTHFQELRNIKGIAPYRQKQSKKVMTVQSLIVCDILLFTEI